MLTGATSSKGLLLAAAALVLPLADLARAQTIDDGSETVGT
jgi:hypothetical protein